MPTTRTAIATAADRSAQLGSIPTGFHIAAAAWVSAMLALAAADPYRYEALLQEDRLVEWWTVGLFAAAALVRFHQAIPRRRIFDLLVALFCLFVAGEEFSWGQRLLGFTPPAPFLEHNTQQEFTLHNFGDVFGKPKGALVLALLGYGLCLPLVEGFLPGRRLLARLGATAPPVSTVPWFLGAAGLLVWYPADFTGEWVETLAGALLFGSALPSRRTLWRGAGLSVAAAVALSLLSGSINRVNPAQLTCARAEVEALLADAVAGGAATPKLLRRKGSVHKRVWTAIEDEYLDPKPMRTFAGTRCDGRAGGDAGRRRYMIDPWGMAYWIRAERPRAGGRRLIVYSMGPNRRRDGAPGEGKGDDITAIAFLPVPD